MTPCQMLTAEEAAVIAGCQPSTVEAAWRDGRLPGFKLGTSWLVPASALYQGLHDLAMRNMQQSCTEPAPAPVPASVLRQQAANDPNSLRRRHGDARPLPVLPPLPKP